MALGAATPAPPGFIELCAHRPAVCGLETASADLSKVSTGGLAPADAPAAGRYNAAFWRAALAADAPAATSSAQQRPLQPARYGLRSAKYTGRDSVSALSLTGPAPEQKQSGAAFAVPFEPGLWKQVVDVNRKVNEVVHERSDLSATGMVDQWDLPIVDGTLGGDCEDYALEKRRLLLEAGLPASALSLAIVRTSWGQSHAVLLVTTDRGEYVLDSLSPWISAWSDLNYAWVQRQAPGSQMRWVGISKS
jgi:predicted transglutaminase-like cysteine proteinase